MTDPTEALAERLFRDAAGALEVYTIYLGERLGLYRALHEGGPATSGELAVRTGTNERYVREWLEHHAASGLLDVDDVATDPLARRFSLPAAHVPVLVDRDDVGFGAYRAIDIVRVARPLPDLVDAFRNGTAPPPLPWEPEVDYVPTQVFTEYLRYAFPGRSPDGLVFSSARARGHNYVLFCGPESVTAHGNQRDDAVLMIDPAALTGYRCRVSKFVANSHAKWRIVANPPRT